MTIKILMVITATSETVAICFIAHTVRQPLSEAVLRADIPQAERILHSLKPAGILSRV
jgi:hypothetical protein